MGRHQSPTRGPRRRHWLVLLTALAGVGCGGQRGDVSGTVTYRGKALPVGSITFLATDNQSAGSSAITHGKYTMAKVPVGPVKVIVTTPRKPFTLSQRSRLRMAKKAPPTDGAPPVEEVTQPGSVIIPEKYASPDASGLTYTVQPGQQEHNIDLE